MGARREQTKATSSIQRIYRGKKSRRDQENKHRGPRPLERDDIVRGLHTLGRGACDLSHAYLGLSVPDLNLDDLSLIKNYDRLESVDVSQNALASLKPLERLPCNRRANLSPTSRGGAAAGDVDSPWSRGWGRG